MTNARTTRRALLTSILSLLLCCSMLLGTTFAWFTDTVTSANNIITAGNLDVELYYQNDETSNWTKVDANTNIFKTNTLWEPGHTEVIKLKVVNEGTLSLKYQLGVNVESEVTSTNVLGGELKLSDHIKYGIVEGEENYTRDEAIAAVEATANKLNQAYNSGTTKLDPKTDDPAISNEKIVTMVVYMPYSVGNEANYAKNAQVPTINLGINLFATQVEAEKDSFGNDYDENATHKDFKVLSEGDLSAALANAEPGNTITVMDDIKLTESLVIPAPETTTYSLRATPNYITIDLNGKTITGDGLDAEGGKVHTLVNNGNLVLVDGTVKSTGTNGGSAIYNYGNLILDNVSVVGAPSDTATGTASYALNTAGAESSVVLNNVNISGRGVIGATNGAKVEINGGTYHTPAIAWGHAVYADGEGTEVVINDGTFSEGYEYSTTNWGMYQIYSGNKAKVTVKGGTFMPWDCANGYDLCTANEGVIEIYGGTFAEDPSKQNKINYVVEGYKVTENADKTYTVAFPQESFDELINNAKAGETVEVPVGNFTLSGNNDLVIVGSGEDTVITMTGSIENANISNATISGEPRLAVKTGQTAEFNNVYFEGAKAWGSVQGTANFTGCTFDGLLHIDSSAETTTIKFTDCTFGEYSIIKLGGSADYILDGCVVETLAADATGAWGKEWLITYCDTTFTNCELGRVIRAGKTINIVMNDCVDAAGAAVTGDIVHTNADPIIVIDGVVQARTAEGLSTALGEGKSNIALAAGNYLMPSSGTTGKVAISGTKDTVLDVTNGAYMDGANVTITGVTIKTSTGKVNGNGSDYAALYSPNVTYTDCTFVGPMRVGRDGAKFINCTFTELGNDYVWTYGNDVTFENCTFNTDGKAILIYSDGGTEVSEVVVKNCTFNSTTGAKAGAIANQNCAAIEIHNYGNGVNLVTEGNTYNSTFSGEWRIKTYENGKPSITVNGTTYTTIALDGKTMTIDANKNVTVNQ